ncbi:hypothetical protein FN846DRAFT_900280 [Sphaerosporella brunnea]|uniref:SH3 domain-containing protein n=1 Tax=Sphaerosporella brunnea TaxID=1250544 RepID=A0A5J5EMX9_9PEZI|nr:hypothetical protein FN846DRAFT_900280 [Sphaerosporella brunnea]
MLMGTGLIAASMLLLPYAAADCIPLTGSTQCSAFQQAQISTSNALTSNYPFLRFVSNTTSFDSKFLEYTNTDYVTFKYGNLFGCDNLTSTLPDTSQFYARYTQTVLCSRMIQDSRSDCSLSNSDATPVCADTCAQFARSEQMIVSNPDTCSNSNEQTIGIIRSDFTICSNPAASLDESCIEGNQNESENCGFRGNLLGLCLYCAADSSDSIDTCCYSANAQGKCAGIHLPTFTNLPPITTSTTTTTATASSTPEGHDSGLSGGAIAGITIGCLVLVGALVFALLFFWRRRRYGSQPPSIFNQPTRSRARAPSMTLATVGPVHGTGQGYEALAGVGGRVARMSALEDNSSEIDVSSSSAPHQHISRQIIGASSSSDFGLESSPGTHRGSARHRALNPPPRGRNASLSSSSMFLSGPTSPGMTSSEKGSEFSSPSEQLPYFKDYYSSDDIHPGDKVACLWAYAPRAQDEFELERGDMLKVVGIWDDGWATGIFLTERADDISRRRSMRDSGVSAQGSHRRRPSSPPAADGEIKAFPLVCVCLPEHWQKTVENEAHLTPEYDSSQSDFSGPRTEKSPSPDRRIGGESPSRFKDDLNVPRSSTPAPRHSSSKVGTSFLDP